MPDLAVIMSVYHNDKLEFVKQSIQSILDQTFSQFHFFIVFDGPVSVGVDKYISSLDDERIRLYRLDENKGLAVALNHLLSEVLKLPEYQFIARMDADDISMPLRFEKQYKFLSEHPDISVVGSWYEEIDESGMYLTFRKLPIDHESLKKRYMTRAPFAHSSVMYHRRLIELSGFYPTDTILMEDNVLWGNAISCDLKFANIPEYLIKFRKDSNFYKRRSGFRYGWNYIKTRYAVNKTLALPIYSYILTSFIGLFKMMPSFIVRCIYA